MRELKGIEVGTVDDRGSRLTVLYASAYYDGHAVFSAVPMSEFWFQDRDVDIEALVVGQLLADARYLFGTGPLVEL